MKLEVMNGTEVRYENEKMIIQAQKDTNLFNAMSGTWKCNTFPYCYTKMTGDFLVRCRVEAEFKSLYDLGALVIYENEDRWIKLAFENSDTGVPAIVSVVTEETSDDCNGQSIADNAVWLQICRQGDTFALHYSTDGLSWKLVRIFRLKMQEQVMVGISAQCPTGDGCAVSFSGVIIGENPYIDIRSLRKQGE